MFGNVKFRFLLAPIVLALLVVVTSPTSWAGALEDAQEAVRQNPNDAEAHHKLGFIYSELEMYREAIVSYEKSIKIKPSERLKINLKVIYDHFQKAITSYRKTIIERDFSPKTYVEHAKLESARQLAYVKLGKAYETLGDNDSAISTY